MKMNIFFSSTLIEINSQRFRKGFAMLCDSTETALRIDSQWNRSQICQSVRASYVILFTTADVQNQPSFKFLHLNWNYNLNYTLSGLDSQTFKACVLGNLIRKIKVLFSSFYRSLMHPNFSPHSEQIRGKE